VKTLVTVNVVRMCKSILCFNCGFELLMVLQHPGALTDVPLTMVTTVEQLEELSKLLTSVKEFAVDLEVHVPYVH